MLDSGTALASLYTSDLEKLGVDKRDYGAQGYCTLHTTNGPLSCRVYELHVTPHGNDGTRIINPHDPVHGPNPIDGGPPAQDWCGAILPVAEIVGRPKRNQEGGMTNDRLSGLMPFLAAYVQITPGHNCMLLGETRTDVIGHFKLPPFNRWWMIRTIRSISILKVAVEYFHRRLLIASTTQGQDQTPVSRSGWAQLGEPAMRLDHGNQVSEYDEGSRRVRVIYNSTQLPPNRKEYILKP